MVGKRIRDCNEFRVEPLNIFNAYLLCHITLNQYKTFTPRRAHQDFQMKIFSWTFSDKDFHMDIFR